MSKTLQQIVAEQICEQHDQILDKLFLVRAKADDLGLDDDDESLDELKMLHNKLDDIQRILQNL